MTVFIGENGAGKSSVIDAITFSLFGKTTRGTQETLFKDGESQAYTKTKFHINGKDFQVLKKIQKNGSGKHEIFDESGTIIAKGASEVAKEVSNRIGLTTNAKNPLQSELQLLKLFPEEKLNVAHHWLILHGRYVCKARRAECENCGITSICKYYKKNKE